MAGKARLPNFIGAAGVPLVFLAFVPSASAREGDAAALQTVVDGLATRASMRNAIVSVAVVEVGSARTLVTREASRKVSVASNAKLITSAAALSQLGVGYRFRTSIYAPDAKAGTVDWLYIKGGGDPSLREGDIWRLVTDVRQAGIRRVKRGIVLDETFFDAKRSPPLYDTRTSDAYYRPQIGALSIHENVVALLVRPSLTVGRPPEISFVPPTPYIKVVNDAVTSQRRGTQLVVKSSADGPRTKIELTGRVASDFRGRWFRKRIEHPDAYFAQTFMALLRRRGVRVRRKFKHGKVPDGAEAIAIRVSRPLGGLIRRMNKASSNFFAEQLLKVMGAESAGAPGTWQAGLKVVESYLSAAGIAVGSYQMKNGAGLYEATKFSAEQIVKVVRHALLDYRIAPEYLASLPVAGVDGTLAHRFSGSGAESYVRAKTGTLNSVVSLSGVIGSQGTKPRLAFSILITSLPKGRILHARKTADAIATAVVKFAATR